MLRGIHIPNHQMKNKQLIAANNLSIAAVSVASQVTRALDFAGIDYTITSATKENLIEIKSDDKNALDTIKKVALNKKVTISGTNPIQIVVGEKKTEVSAQKPTATAAATKEEPSKAS